jgi:glycosyltransferase involved in cell wall biosynthesis
MNILFVHNNFPAQFKHVARALADDPAVTVAAIGAPTAQPVRDVKLLKYIVTDGDVSATHPFARRFDLECRRAEQVLYAASSLVQSGFAPDVIVAHSGWGESLPLRAIFPKARLVVYSEFYYGVAGRDVGFDPEFPETGVDGHTALHLKNATALLALADCDEAISPTEWQRSTHPPAFASKIRVIHEGVDIDLASPDDKATFHLPNGQQLSSGDEVVTFVARNLEPIRGYHIFMRALPKILARRPQAQVLIVGADGVSYGMSPPKGQTWKSIFYREVESRIDKGRVHFLGRLRHEDYLRVLKISAAHVYLTYPFVLSWSCLEAMSTGCLVIGSDTPPVQEVLSPDTGVPFPFFDVEGLADRVIDALANPSRYRSQREKARKLVLDQFDTRRICVPKFMDLIGYEAAPSQETSRERMRSRRTR